MIATGLLVIASVLLALRLDASAAPDTLVDSNDDAAAATKRFHREFGGEPVAVLVRGRSGTLKCEPECRLPELLLTSDLARIAALEGCLSGNVPRGAKPLAPVCTELARKRPFEVVYGPGTFVNESVRQVSARFEAQRLQKSREAARASRAARQVARARGLSKAEQGRLARRAGQLVYAQFARDALKLALSYGLTTVPSVNNPEFLLRLVFEPSLGAGVPKPRFAYLFPSESSALIQARLREGLSEAERKQSIGLVKEAVASPRLRLERGEYVVSGGPVVREGMASDLPGALVVLLIAGFVGTGATLALTFRARRRLLPVAPAFVVAALTLGAMSLAGVSLTIATIAVVPVVFALAVGCAIHLQTRHDEAGGSPRAAGAPVIAAAVLATTAGCLALLASSVPTVRSFGALVALGIMLSLACGLIVGSVLLAGATRVLALPALPQLRRRMSRLALTRPSFDGSRRRVTAVARPVTAVGRRLTAVARHTRVVRGGLVAIARRVAAAGRWLGGVGVRLAALWRSLRGVALRRPRRVLAIALAVALAGWVVQGRTEVVSDLTQLAPRDLPAVADARAVQRETGRAGELNVVVRGSDLTSAAAIRWMSGYQERVLDRHGYSEERSCRQAELCPGLSVTNLLGSGRTERPQVIAALLDALPRYFSRAVISRDRRTATIAFSVRAMPLDRQKDLVDDLRNQLDPPAGLRAELAGAPVVAADANPELESRQRLLTLASLILVFALLLALNRRAQRAFVLLIPLLLVSGWSALVLFVLGVPLNPLSAALGALVVAVCAQPVVIVSDRYRRERESGHPPAAALARAHELSSAALFASGATAVAGFATLIVSDVRMVREFGFVATIDLAVTLAAVMVALPAALAWSEQWRPAGSIRGVERRLRRVAPARARSARGGR
jgi:uncharacterized protein